MKLDTLDIIFISTVVSFTIIIFLWVRITITKAIRKKIIPELLSNGYLLESYKWLGPIPFGLSTNHKQKFTLLFSMTGRPGVTLYVRIYYKRNDQSKQIKGIVKIQTLFFFTRKVEFHLYENS